MRPDYRLPKLADTTLDDRLIELYVAGECTLAEQAAIERWITANPARGAELRVMRLAGMTEATQLYAASDAAVDLDAVTQAVLRGVSQEQQDSLERASPADEAHAPRLRMRGRLSGLASVSKSVGLGQQALRRRTNCVVQARDRRMAVLVGAAVVVIASVVLLRDRATLTTSTTSSQSYQTASGQQATVTLANGARAQLGPATHLTVSTNSSDASTTVSLVGQAQFVVDHNDKTSFIVRTGNTVTRVLGTTFMVRRYGTDRVAQVVVTEGRVSLHGRYKTRTIGTGTVLGARTIAIVDDSGKVHVTSDIAIEDYTAWTTGQLVFRQTPVRDAVVELGRAYGVDIRVADSTLAEHPLNWTVVVANRSLTDVLEFLSAVLDAHPVRVGRVITFVSGQSSGRRPGGSLSPHLSERQYGR